VIKSRKVSYKVSVAHIEELRNVRISDGKLEGKIPLGRFGVDGRI
jgi:hypothetical protein